MMIFNRHGDFGMLKLASALVWVLKNVEFIADNE